MVSETVISSSQKTLTIFGATGSVGQSTLNLVRSHREKFKIFGLTAHQDVDGLAALALEFSPEIVVISDESCADSLSAKLAGSDIRILSGSKALDELAALRVDVVIAAIVGMAGLSSVAAAVQAGQKIALANKEALVAAGHLVMPALAETGAEILPIDSEHNAIFQCLMGEKSQDIVSITLTASGGPFRDLDPSELKGVELADALKHPNWEMGSKITIDSATMMNKGLELIEAYWLFGVAPDQLQAVLHPQSVIHGLVGFCDGSWLAHLGVADMRVPISHALGYPHRLGWECEQMDLVRLSQLDFRSINDALFPAFALARSVIGTNPANAVILNTANEVAVEAFLHGRIHFTDIPALIERALNMGCDGRTLSGYDDIIALDDEIRRRLGA